MKRRTNINDLVELVTRTISHAQEKFTDSKTTLSPDFMLGFSLSNQGIDRATFTPILNHWGFGTIDYLMTGEGSSCLPWLHEDTWRYLTDSSEDSPAEKPLVLDSERGWSAVTEGIRAGQIMFTQSPESIHLYTPSIAGGTRTGGKILVSKMQRPWQVEGPIHKLEDCPLCKRSEREKQGVGEPGYKDLNVIHNRFTPYNFHQLIVPTSSFYKNTGDDNSFIYQQEGLAQVLDLAFDTFFNSKKQTLMLGVHKGYLAGQNLGHLHFHLHSHD